MYTCNRNFISAFTLASQVIPTQSSTLLHWTTTRLSFHESIIKFILLQKKIEHCGAEEPVAFAITYLLYTGNYFKIWLCLCMYASE